MKKRITIYIDEGVWGLAQQRAYQVSAEKKMGVSASKVVEDAISAFVKKVPREGKCEYCKKVHDLRVACPAQVKIKRSALSEVEGLIEKEPSPKIEAETKDEVYIESKSKPAKKPSPKKTKKKKSAADRIREKMKTVTNEVETSKGSVSANDAMSDFFHPQPKGEK